MDIRCIEPPLPRIRPLSRCINSPSTYRGHAHTLARGVPVEKVLGELMQRDNGLMRGKGGSMHLMSTEHGVMGSYAIIGAHLPIACGAAWRAQYKGDKDVTTCFFGDGTTNIGAFHEALNFAAVWKLPVIFVCENNFYMEYTPIADVTAVPHPAADRASAYGLERIVIDGNDADECYRAAQKAFAKARAGEGPSLIECMTYRHSGHSRADPAKYRPEGELEKWKLPVIFVCENNLYMEYTPIADVTAVPSPAGDRASAYGLEKIVIDGNDADVVYREAIKAYDKARSGGGPSLIECLTYRHSGHSRADPAKYRPEGELEKWKERDPIKIYRERLKQFGVSDATIAKIDAEVQQVVDEATEAC